MAIPTQTASSDADRPAPGDDRSRFYIPGLDGLRAVAFLMVWGLHAAMPDVPIEAPPIRWGAALVQTGIFGVPVFFVLSAFLITRLLMMERERCGMIDLKAYYVRRTLRIWPLYYLVVGLAAIDWLQEGFPLRFAFLSLLTFTANWYRVFAYPFTNFSACLWSVSVEEQFYIVWPFVLRRLSRRAIERVCVAMIALACVSRLAIGWKTHDFGPLWHASTSHMDSLALGTLLALHADRIPRLRPVAWYAAFLGILAAMVVESRYCPLNLSTPPGIKAAAGLTAIPFLAAGLVALATHSKHRFLAHPWVVWAGRLSFGMYVFHEATLDEARALNTGTWGILLSLPILAGIAWLSYRFYEQPFLRLKHRFERVQSRPD